MFIGQFNALQELHLWVCLNLQELTSIGVMGTKTTKTIRFPKDMNKGRLNFKSQIMKQKHM
jgi:hypothetical protein